MPSDYSLDASPNAATQLPVDASPSAPTGADSSPALAKPLLVTGVNGFIASHVVYQLLDRGYHVRGTVRDKDAPSNAFLRDFHPAAKRNLELVSADLTSEAPELWDGLVDGVETILHIASPFTFRGKLEHLSSTAVTGTRNVVTAALRTTSSATRVKRIVLTASVVTIYEGLSRERYAAAEKGEVFTEKDFANPDGPTVDGYARSKILAEREAWNLLCGGWDAEHVPPKQTTESTFESRRVELVTLHPAFVTGPLFDAAQSKGESSTIMLELMNKKHPLVPQLNTSFVDVRDVALAHILAAEAPSEKVAFQRIIVAADDGLQLSFLDQTRWLHQNFARFEFKPTTLQAPALFIKFLGVFNDHLKVAGAKVGKCHKVSNAKLHDLLLTPNGVESTRSTYDSWKDMVLSLIKCGALPPKNMNQSVIQSLHPYGKSVDLEVCATNA